MNAGKSLTAMSGPELVDHFNALPVNRGKPPVKRFASRADALKRIARCSDDKEFTIDEFDVRAGTNRALALSALGFNAMKPVSALIKAVYGPVGGSKGSLGMVIKGLQLIIEKKKLPCQITKGKDPATKEVTYGLFTE